MCDDRTVADNNEYLRAMKLTRRQFGAVSAGAGLAMLWPRAANAQAVSESDLDVTTPDGVADCYFVHPSSGAHPGVLIWPDAFGLRPAKKQMAKRLAESGYSVLVVNPYYRSQQAPVVNTTNFAEVRDTLMPLMGSLNADTQTRDAMAFISFLDSQPAVDQSRKMGTMGYCMGGPFTMRTAAAVPDRIGAAASFHGGGLVTDAADSPHLLVPKMTAHYLFAIAENDDENQPDAKDVLRDAFAQDCQRRLKCTRAQCTDGARPIRPSTTRRRRSGRGAVCWDCLKTRSRSARPTAHQTRLVADQPAGRLPL